MLNSASCLLDWSSQVVYVSNPLYCVVLISQYSDQPLRVKDINGSIFVLFPTNPQVNLYPQKREKALIETGLLDTPLTTLSMGIKRVTD